MQRSATSRTRTRQGFALLEAALCCSLVLPLLYLAYAVFDYWHDLRALRSLTLRFAQAVPVKPMHLHSGWHGFFVRVRDRTPGADGGGHDKKGEAGDLEDLDPSEKHLIEYAREERAAFYGEFVAWFAEFKKQVEGSDLCQKLQCNAANLRIEMIPAVLEINQNTGKVHKVHFPTIQNLSYGNPGLSLTTEIQNQISASDAEAELIQPSALLGSQVRQLYGTLSGNDFGAADEASQKITDSLEGEEKVNAFLAVTNAKRGYVRYAVVLGVGLQIDTSTSWFGSLVASKSGGVEKFQVIEVRALRKSF